jgi:hypothetical protein
MLRGHVARQRSGRRRVLSSINAGLHGFTSGSARWLMSWATSSGSPPEREVKGKAWTRVSTGSLLTPGSSSFRDLVEVRTLLGGSGLIRIGVRCPSMEVWTPRYILGCVVFSCHMAPFGLPMRWGQAPSSMWPGDVAWVRRLHAIEQGTPNLWYRQWPPGPPQEGIRSCWWGQSLIGGWPAAPARLLM